MAGVHQTLATLKCNIHPGTSVVRSGQAIRGMGLIDAILSHSTLHMTLIHWTEHVTNSTNINLDFCHWPKVAWSSSKPMNQDYCTRRIIPGWHLAWLSLCHGRDIAMCQQNFICACKQGIEDVETCCITTSRMSVSSWSVHATVSELHIT